MRGIDVADVMVIMIPRSRPPPLQITMTATIIITTTTGTMGLRAGQDKTNNEREGWGMNNARRRITKKMTMAEAFGRALREVYNEGLPEAEQLPEWDAATPSRKDRSARDDKNRVRQ
jgi:hypothetical protein